MLQQDQPDDFVIATGKTTSVRDFVKLSFKQLGIELKFEGTGIEEKGYISAVHNTDLEVEVGQQVIGIDKRYFRPTEVDLLIGDPTKANEQLGWYPKYDLEALVAEMVESDLEFFRKDQLLQKAGYRTERYYE
jgi:GDPmannose 4,6-dehydratase